MSNKIIQIINKINDTCLIIKNLDKKDSDIVHDLFKNLYSEILSITESDLDEERFLVFKIHLKEEVQTKLTLDWLSTKDNYAVYKNFRQVRQDLKRWSAFLVLLLVE